MNRKMISLLLALILASGTLASCANPKDPAETAGTESESATDTTPVETEPETVRYAAEVPGGTDLGGRKFTVLAFAAEDVVWNDVDWNATELTGEVLNDAVYTRTKNTEDLLNVEIDVEHVSARGNTSALTNSVKANDDAYQLFNGIIQGTFSLGQSGYLAELNDFAAQGTLRLDSPWWDQNALADLSINHKNYAITGDIGTMYKKSIGVIMFNKSIHADYDLEDPYTLMDEGAWTIDKMVEMGAQVSEDLNGDGVMDENDRYGLICFCDMMGLAMIGCDVRFATKNDADIPELTMLSEKSVSVMEKLATLMYDENLTYSWSAANKSEETAFAMYKQDQSLFYYGELHAVATMREMESPFGIMPMPLYDSEQDGYHHCINPNVAAIYTIPVTNTAYTETGYILDTLGAESKNLLTPAYYNTTLIGKVTRDEESARSLDVIISTVRYDIGYLAGLNMSSLLYSMANARQTNLASQYEKRANSFQKSLDKLVAAYTAE